ncbi:CGP-CTERM sorting domain-containing protein [Thermococcus sp. M39]|uniref:CGP-CTERM sorting domain-containing protein n=1 Tax=Thermococcus sp. M39 TaxID=1638262 RepID=UPI001439D08C|nr:CGP-CTERM sorting domain-containing protein [Thermococcus sp. M39]NJE08319.1 CGP-CTERM sorting domain-containing protein [Thermococcus sp. M39]
MSRLIFVFMLIPLVASLSLADGFTYTYSSIVGTGNDVIILIEWTPTMIDPLCAPRPCCYNEVPADCCHYIVFYANDSGVYYVAYVYNPVAFSSENGTYLFPGIYRAYNGCFQRLGDAPGKARFVFPYIAARISNKLTIYHLGCNMSKIGEVSVTSKCTFDLSSRNLIVSCPNGTRRFALSDSGMVEVSAVKRWIIFGTKRPSVVQGRLENNTLVFLNGSRTYKIPFRELLPYLYDSRELKFLTGVFMKDALLILPPTMNYEYCIYNGTFSSRLSFTSPLSRSEFVVDDFKLSEFKPVYAFLYNGTLKPIPLFLPDGEYFKPLAPKVVIKRECPCPVRTSSAEANASGTDNKICGPGLLLFLSLLILKRKQ